MTTIQHHMLQNTQRNKVLCVPGILCYSILCLKSKNIGFKVGNGEAEKGDIFSMLPSMDHRTLQSKCTISLKIKKLKIKKGIFLTNVINFFFILENDIHVICSSA